MAERDQEKKLDELFESLKVFKDCNMGEFVDIFGVKHNPNLPLYANLYILKQYFDYYTMLDSILNRNALFATIGMNFAYYYSLRRILHPDTHYFARFPRTALFYSIYIYGVYLMSRGQFES